MTPARKAGAPHADTYVVCLECGKQFLYDMQAMRIGRAVPVSPTEGVLQHATPSPKTKKLRYVAFASALPVAWGVAAAVKRLKKSREQS